MSRPQDTSATRRPSILEEVPIDLPEIQAEQLKVFSQIGQGRFKTVSSGCYYRRGNAAILRYKANNNANEVRILSHLSHHNASEHAVETYGVMRESGTYVVAQELATFGSIKSVLLDPELIAHVTPTHKLQIASQIARAVSFLGSLHLIHTDLACRNFLVFTLDNKPEHTNVKVTDFMSSLILSPEVDSVRRKLPQASRWCAPETVTFNEWSYKTEVWSLGVTLWELFNNCMLPWTNCKKRSDVVQKLKELAWSLNDGSTPSDSHMALEFPPPPESGTISTSTMATVMSCLRPDASARATSKQIEQFFCQMVGAPVGSQKSQPRKHTTVVPNVALPQGAQHSQPQQSTPAPIRADMPKTNVIVHPSARSSTPAKEFETCASTPSTRCPTALSTPRLVTVCKSSDSSCAGYPSAASYERYATPESHFGGRTPQHSESIQQFQKLLWYSPTWPRKAEALGNMKAFLSCPEAVCGLGIETQVMMRSEIAAAQAARTRLHTSPLLVQG